MPDEPLLSLIHSIAIADGPAVTGALRSQPELAMAILARGATRQEATDFFLSEIVHYVYAGDTALHIAAAAYNVTVVNELAGLGADCDAMNRTGARPLHYAVDGGPGADSWDPGAQGQTVTALLQLGADPNAADGNDTPPLLRAVRNRCTSAVEALLTGGADATVTNRRGSTALKLATSTTGRGGSGTVEAKAEQAKIVELLEAAMRP